MTTANHRGHNFLLSRKISWGIVLLALATTTSTIYAFYSLGGNAIAGTHIHIMMAIRTFLGGTFPDRNVTYFIETQVSSGGAWLDTRVSAPKFFAQADGVALGNLTLPSSTYRPGGYSTYDLRYSINESANPRTLSYSANHMIVEMNGLVSSGLYQQTITRFDDASWNWTTITCYLLCD